MRQAVILAGGKGTRLADRLNGAPKPLVPVLGEALLGRQVRDLARLGFTRILLLVNHREDAIRDFCSGLDIPDLRVEVRSDGGTPRGTAGALWDAADLLADRFLVVYGDTLFDIDLDRFWRAHLDAHAHSGALGTLFLHPNDHPYDSDLVDMAEDGTVLAFHPKPHAPHLICRNLVNAALYVLEKRLLLEQALPEGVVDFGKDVFPAALAAGLPLHGYVTFEYIKDIGTPDRLDRAESDLRSGKVAGRRLDRAQKAVFIDRDGTLNHPAGHVASPDQLTLFPGVGTAIARLNKAEYRCVLATNQPVLARGEATPADLAAIHAKLETELGAARAYLDAIYVCPHHPDRGFVGEVAELKRVCDCRKPAPGLLLRGISELSVDPRESWMVGDGPADLGAASAAGIRSILVRTGGHTTRSVPTPPSYEVDDFVAAVDLILEGRAAVMAALAEPLATIVPGALVCIAGPPRAGKSIVAGVLREMLAGAGLTVVDQPADMLCSDQPVTPPPPSNVVKLIEAPDAFARAIGDAGVICKIYVDCPKSVWSARFWRARRAAGQPDAEIGARYNEILATDMPRIENQRSEADWVVRGFVGSQEGDAH